MKKNQWVWISLLAVLLLSVGVYAQDGEGDTDGSAEPAATEAASDNTSSSGSGILLEEAVFALIAVAIVMAGLIGFEYIQTTKTR